MAQQTTKQSTQPRQTDTERRVAAGETVRIGNSVYQPAGNAVPAGATGVTTSGGMTAYYPPRRTR